MSGPHSGAFFFPHGNENYLRFYPFTPFSQGELVTVVFTTGLEATTRVAMASGFGWSFTIAIAPTAGTFFKDAAYAVGDLPLDVVSADFDRDGDNDLAVPNRNTNNISVLLRNGRESTDSRPVFNSVLPRAPSL